MNENHPKSDVPVALAPLSREQVGPFLILGVPKDADDAAIEAAWALRVLWARQGKTRMSLEDIHWARAVLRDPAQRLAADAGSLNPDTTGDELRRLTKLWRLDGKPGWTPYDPEPPAVEVDIPDPADARSAVTAPAVPIDLPGVGRWLDEFAKAPLDPWSLALPLAEPQGKPNE
jgi:hypothetical protein